MIYCKYGFIFDKSELYDQQADFEIALAKAFDSLGISVEKIDPAQGQDNVPLILLTKKDEEESQAEENSETPAKEKSEGLTFDLPQVIKRVRVMK